MLSDIDHDFCLFDSINTKFSFKILVKFNKVCRITSVFHNNINHSLHHISTCCWSRGAYCSWGRGWCWFYNRRNFDLRCGLFCWRFDFNWEAFKGSSHLVYIALNSSVKIVISINICNQLIIENTQLNIVILCKITAPCKQALSINSFSDNRPRSDHRKPNLRTESCCEAHTIFQFGIIASR